jgi:hypothetical protein
MKWNEMFNVIVSLTKGKGLFDASGPVRVCVWLGQESGESVKET